MKHVYVIWHHVRCSNIADLKEVVGVVLGDYQEANTVVDKLNEADDEKPMFGHNYWKEEFNVLTPTNVLE